jgi:hypothetical protein
MGFDLYNTLIPAILIIVVVLALEEWAYFKATTKLGRAIITAVSVLVLLVVFNLIAGPSH